MTDAPSAQWVPQDGAGRLAETAQGKCFTSDLSVDEFILVRESGFVPLGLVMGTSMYHMGLQYAGWKQSVELTTLSQAMYAARELAMKRMQDEGERDGAAGIVRVRVEENNQVWGEHGVEFFAMGTGVRSVAATTTSTLPLVVPV